ncbi:MAG: tannase/feruloyl esterase family alpha/beta hydrolase, partial [Croceibacterium sp.]
REAFTEAQRYPDDFDGLVAGAAASLITEAMERFLWEARWGIDAAGKPVFDPRGAGILHAAVMESCDAVDGLRDGQIDDPRRCRFAPASIRCSASRVAAEGCLSPVQVDVAEKFYQGPVDASGRHLYPGGEAFGSELTWSERGSLAGAGRSMFEDNVRTMIFQRQLPEELTLETWQWDAATLRELSRRGAIYDANNPDLRPLRASGGKMMIWYGAADPAAGVDAMPDYYQRVRDAVGGSAAARAFVRMYPIPGVYHCGNGYIPYQLNLLSAIVDWVERGQAPAQLNTAALLPDGRVRTRPVFAYPVRAVYNGTGSIDDAANFHGEAPAHEPADRYRWLGASTAGAMGRSAARRQ